MRGPGIGQAARSQKRVFAAEGKLLLALTPLLGFVIVPLIATRILAAALDLTKSY